MHLVGGITGAAASLVVDVTTGLPSVPFTLLLDPGLGVEEVIEVTAIGGTTLTVTRGVDGTSAQAHTNGGEVRHAYSARDFQDSRNHEADTTTAHGVSGGVVGTTNTQALTNKAVDGSLNTFSNVPKVALPADVTYNATVQTLTNKTIDGAGNTFTNVPAASVVGLVANEAATAAHAAATAAHGVTGAVVGTTDVQTLTNKTLTGPTLNLPALAGASIPVTGSMAISGSLTVGGRPVQHVESGNVNHVYAGGVGPVSTIVTFDNAFTSIPAITLGCGSFNLQIEYGSPTTTGFTLFSKGFNNTVPASATYLISWIAAGA